MLRMKFRENERNTKKNRKGEIEPRDSEKNLIHNAIEYVYHYFVKKFHWPNIKKQIENVRRECITSQKFN